MKKITFGIENVIHVIYALIYIAIITILLGFQWIEYYRKREFLIPNLLIAIITILLFVVAGSIIQKKRHIKVKQLNFDKIVKIGSVILVLLQFLICFNIYFMAGWDSKIITSNADHIANGRISELENWYYTRWPNNTLLTSVYALIFWMAEHIGIPSRYVRLLLCFIQCMISTATGYMIYQCTKKYVKKVRCAFAGWIFYVLLLGVSPWIVVPYSDSFCLFVPVTLLYIYQIIENNKFVYLKGILLSFLAYLGYQIKPMVVIVFIAIVVVEIIKNIQESVAWKKWSLLAVMVGSIFVVASAYNAIDLSARLGFQLNKEGEYQIYHYFMMGLNDEASGQYLTDDIDFSAACATKEERKQENIRVATERIKAYGLKGLLRHTAEKTLSNFNDGSFAWGQEGGFYDSIPNVPNTPFKIFFRNYYYENGSMHNVFLHFSQTCWIVVMIGVGFSAILRNKEEEDRNYLVLIISTIGIVMFVTLFEARARYLLTFVPLLIIVSVSGYEKFWNKWINKRGEECECKVDQ